METTVLFADVSGSTKLYDEAGDAIAFAAIRRCIDLFREKTISGGGQVIKTMGDEILALFPNPSAAAEAAIGIQLGLAAMSEPIPGLRMAARIGFNMGAVMERNEDIFGDTVNLAARFTELATRGQVITSQETANALSPLLKMDSRRLFSIPIKGKTEEIDICELLWGEMDDATTMIPKNDSPVMRVITGIRIRYKDRTIEMPRDCATLNLGRDLDADLVVEDRMASRMHCVVEHRQDKFVVIDRSSNGTFVTIGSDREIMLRREELILRGQGFIALGQSWETSEDVVQFSVN